MRMVSWIWKNNSKDQEIDQDQLKKKGFNPQGLELEESKEQPIVDFDSDYDGFILPTVQETEILLNKKIVLVNEEEHRHVLAHDKGGKICGNKKQVAKIRSIGKQMIKLIGKKVISGDLNLTRISFPIKSMVPKTALENSTLACSTMPYFMKYASQCKQALERMKWVITSVISSAYYMNLFLKPLNPVIGQTLQGNYPDGTKIYCEQISHHPPYSYFLLIGPKQSYRYYGYYAFSAHAGLNSMTLVNKGKRVFEFKNNQSIQVNFNKQTYLGAFLGALRSEAIGVLEFTDQKNSLKAEIKYGKVKKRPSDYFIGSITKNGDSISSFDGTYCGYLNFDGIRYWDGRMYEPFKINFEQKTLQSDFKNRLDLQLLRENKISEAQIAKEKIQEQQRKDNKMRESNK